MKSPKISMYSVRQSAGQHVNVVEFVYSLIIVAFDLDSVESSGPSNHFADF